jgi:hypothetical protein
LFFQSDFALPSDLSVAAVRYSCTPAIFIDVAGEALLKIQLSALINHQSLAPARFTIGYYSVFE